MFTSREYEFADITVFLGKRDVTGLRGIEYKESQEKEAMYGKGNKPLSIQKGNKAYDGKVTLTTSELLALESAGKGTVLDMEITIVVSYGNPSQGDMVATDKLIGVQFSEAPKNWKQGDKFAEHELPFLFLDKQPVL